MNVTVALFNWIGRADLNKQKNFRLMDYGYRCSLFAFKKKNYVRYCD